MARGFQNGNDRWTIREEIKTEKKENKQIGAWMTNHPNQKVPVSVVCKKVKHSNKIQRAIENKNKNKKQNANSFTSQPHKNAKLKAHNKNIIRQKGFRYLQKNIGRYNEPVKQIVNQVCDCVDDPCSAPKCYNSSQLIECSKQNCSTSDTCCICYSGTCARQVVVTNKATNNRDATVKAFSSCHLYYRYNYGPAGTEAPSNPVMNVPIKCPHCSDYIYSYLLGVHCGEKHSGCCEVKINVPEHQKYLDRENEQIYSSKR